MVDGTIVGIWTGVGVAEASTSVAGSVGIGVGVVAPPASGESEADGVPIEPHDAKTSAITTVTTTAKRDVCGPKRDALGRRCPLHRCCSIPIRRTNDRFWFLVEEISFRDAVRITDER